MRALALASLLLIAVPLQPAQPQGRAPAPASLGEFQAWTAASHVENGQKVCYIFTRARSAEGVPGRAAANVMLLVTHRPGSRDQVAVQTAYGHPRNAETKLTIGTTEFRFFTAGETAFARDGRAIVAALRGGREAVSRGAGPNGRGQATDTFSLAGFSAAYDAIGRECPAPRR